VTPLSPERYGLQVTLDEPTHAKLRHAAELLSHRVPAGDLAQVLALVLDAAIPELEKRKFAATARPRRTPRGSGKDSRHIPADVRRDVWKRDQGRCTFMSDSGRRCERRTGLQFDHVQAYARGGEATVSGIRLRCRAHNQYEAERTFGPEFMRHKRLAAAAARAQGKVQPAAAAGDHAP
jgi:5-methylcytosine-specific restriction endonuclease McrA